MAEVCPEIIELSDFCVLKKEDGQIYSLPPPCKRPDEKCLATLEGSSYDFLFDLLYVVISILVLCIGCWVGRFVYIKFLILKRDLVVWVLFMASFGVTIRQNEDQTRDLEAGYSAAAPQPPPGNSSLSITYSNLTNNVQE